MDNKFYPARKLFIGANVVNQDGVSGTVTSAGPYGDDPFQVVTSADEHFHFIDVDGRGTYGGQWAVVVPTSRLS